MTTLQHIPGRGGGRLRAEAVLPPAPTLRQVSPASLLRDLTALLRSHGLDHLYATASPTEGVLSVAYGITVWTNGHTLRCDTPTQTIHLPASTHATARYLVRLIVRGPGVTNPASDGPA